MAGLPITPRHPERVCWGCDRFCRADDLACGNGTVRTPHPLETFGEDWRSWAEGNGVLIDENPGRDPSAAVPST